MNEMKLISVKDRLPEKNMTCLVYKRCAWIDWSYPPPEYDYIQESYFIKQYDTFTVNGWTSKMGSDFFEISHWISFDDLPKPERENDV